MKEDKMLYYNLKFNGEYFLICDDKEWSLQRNKFVFREVMNSKDNTEDDLKHFLKEHKIYDYAMISSVRIMALSIFQIILIIINQQLQLTEITYFVHGCIFYIAIEVLTKVLTQGHNDVVKEKILKDDMLYLESKKKEILKKKRKPKSQ